MDAPNRTIVVTGGASGVGYATVQLLRERGSAVAVIDRDVDAAATAFRKMGVRWYEADVAQESQMVSVFQRIRDHSGRIDGLYSNAGIARLEGLIHEESATTWDEVIAVNLRGTFLAVRESIKHMIAQGGGGAIVCASSAVADAAIPGGMNAYTASKGAINALVRQVAVDYAASDIRINAIAPGAIDTPLMWAATPAGDIPTMRKTIDHEVPLGRIGRPIEVGRAVVWLLSSEAAYVTGSVFRVDGGATARLPLSV